jgi:hypothetical protein
MSTGAPPRTDLVRLQPCLCAGQGLRRKMINTHHDIRFARRDSNRCCYRPGQHLTMPSLSYWNSKTETYQNKRLKYIVGTDGNAMNVLWRSLSSGMFGRVGLVEVLPTFQRCLLPPSSSTSETSVKLPPNYMAQHPRRHPSPYSLPWEREISTHS